MKYFFVATLIILIKIPSLGQNHYYSISEEHLSTIHASLNFLYNQKYDSAQVLISELQQQLPDYPGLYLLKAYYYNVRYGPLHEKSEAYESFMNVVDTTILKSEALLKRENSSLEAMFFMLSIHAMLARMYVDTGHNWKAIIEAKKSYRYITKVMDRVEEFPEFNLYCGIYNYYREKYPEDNPYVKPILWFFRSGDKELGLSMLHTGSEQGLFTKMESLTYLYHINMRYEFRPHQSITYARTLKELYPDNRYFSALLVENLIFISEFEKSKCLIDSIICSEYPYHQYIGSVYKGLYTELYELDLDLAEMAYNEALSIGACEDVATPHYQSICFLGLGRISLSRGDLSEARSYLKMAEKTSEYSFIRDEAKETLKSL